MSFCYNCIVKAYNGYRLGTGGAGGMILGTLKLTKTSEVKLVAGHVGAAKYNSTADSGGASRLYVDGVEVAVANGGSGGSSAPSAGAGGSATIKDGTGMLTGNTYAGNNGNTKSYNHSGTGYANGGTLGNMDGVPAIVPRTSVTGSWSMTFVPGCSSCSVASHGTRSAPSHTPNGIGGMVVLLKK